MKIFVMLFIIFAGNTAFAVVIGPPLITYNVHVLQNTSASQCPSTWMGQGSPETPTDISGYGENTYTATNVLSCTACSFNPQSRDCVCATCYNNFN